MTGSPIPSPDRYCTDHWRVAIAAWLLGQRLPPECPVRTLPRRAA